MRAAPTRMQQPTTIRSYMPPLFGLISASPCCAIPCTPLVGLGLGELQVRADDTRQPPAGDRPSLSKAKRLRPHEKMVDGDAEEVVGDVSDMTLVDFFRRVLRCFLFRRRCLGGRRHFLRALCPCFSMSLFLHVVKVPGPDHVGCTNRRRTRRTRRWAGASVVRGVTAEEPARYARWSQQGQETGKGGGRGEARKEALAVFGAIETWQRRPQLCYSS